MRFLLKFLLIICILTLTSPLFLFSDTQALSIEPQHETNFQGQQIILTINGEANQTKLLAWVYYGSYFVKVFPNITLDANGTANVSFFPTIEWHVGVYDVYINHQNRSLDISNETTFILKMNEELWLLYAGNLEDKRDANVKEQQGTQIIIVVITLCGGLLFALSAWWAIWQPAYPWIWFKRTFNREWARFTHPLGSMLFRTLHANQLERHRYLYKRHKAKIRPIVKTRENLKKKIEFLDSKIAFHNRRKDREREEVLSINPTDPHIRDEEIWFEAVEQTPSELRRLREGG